MKKLTFLLLIIFAQNVALAESFGVFRGSWEKFPVNQTVTASYCVKESMPTADKEKLKRLIQQHVSTGRLDFGIRMDIESDIEEILHKYGVYEYARSDEKKRENYIKAMNGPVPVTKSTQVHIRSLSFKHVGSEYLEWKDAFKGKKVHYCAVKADVNWQGVPPEVVMVPFRIKFFDSNGLQISAYDFVSIFRDNMVGDITLYADPSYGKPVRFKIFD
jgi:hypothetical protein